MWEETYFVTVLNTIKRWLRDSFDGNGHCELWFVIIINAIRHTYLQPHFGGVEWECDEICKAGGCSGC